MYHIVEGTRESHPCGDDLQHPQLGKIHGELQIGDTQLDVPVPIQNDDTFL